MLFDFDLDQEAAHVERERASEDRLKEGFNALREDEEISSSSKTYLDLDTEEGEVRIYW